ncbi:H/ACA ribonucleoprotein complex subunit 4-like [Chenopodium quinoa]|uniref:H/ACA ribonucleoprotein complex subunit 4-like n=1 Tax=Chenopodium quinoa TaxID=63459 RepID=UPI000B78238D|nr:H/ACA ribonucleoprotein complex subunit 4-like [Chenopodium quinoa]
MGGKAKKRREKNYLAAHGGNNRLPPPPNTSSIDALPSKLRKILSFGSSPVPANQGSAIDSKNTQKKSNKVDTAQNKPHSKSEVDGKSKGTKGEKVKKSTVPQEKVSNDANEEKNKKKRKRKQANDLRFEAEMEKLDGVSTRKQRKKEFLKAKKKKQKKGSSEQILDLPKHDIVKFGEVAEAPPKLPTIPAFRKAMSASNERLRLQAIEAYRKRKGWTNRPGIHLPPVSTSPDLL